ncbi:MAG: hypothetical protein WKF83_14550 [Nocardioidaceae bacterium]
MVGGDCSILLGIVPALRRHVGTVGLWFIDGHPDFLDGHASETGETADMDLALLTGAGAESLVTLAGAPPMVDALDAVLLGHRADDVDQGAADERARLRCVAQDRRCDHRRRPRGGGPARLDRLSGVGEACGCTWTWTSSTRSRCRR